MRFRRYSILISVKFKTFQKVQCFINVTIKIKDYELQKVFKD